MKKILLMAASVLLIACVSKNNNEDDLTLNSKFDGTMNIYETFEHNDDGSIIDSVVLCAGEGRYGVNIPKRVWHTLESLESGSCIFECKEGPFVEHEVDGVLCLQP